MHSLFYFDIYSLLFILNVKRNILENRQDEKQVRYEYLNDRL